MVVFGVGAVLEASLSARSALYAGVVAFIADGFEKNSAVSTAADLGLMLGISLGLWTARSAF